MRINVFRDPLTWGRLIISYIGRGPPTRPKKKTGGMFFRFNLIKEDRA